VESLTFETLKGDDIPFLQRSVIQALFPRSPTDLSDEARALSEQVHADQRLVGLTDAEEHCPACGLVIPLVDIAVAICSNDHRWSMSYVSAENNAELFVARCSITTFILSTPWVRTCIGCSRKAFLPLSIRTSLEQPSWLPIVARGWVVEELLEAVRRCLYCNNTFVRALWIYLCHLPKVHVHYDRFHTARNEVFCFLRVQSPEAR